MLREKTLMAIMAHPDDAELRCFGTLCKYEELGYTVKVVIVSSGENGISIHDKDNIGVNYIPKSTRLEETKKAFQFTNIIIECLEFQDSNIFLGKELIGEIERKIRQNSPELIITHFPDKFGVDHQDHSAVGRAVINCSTRISSVNKILLCEPLMTFRSGFVPNYYVDITKYFEMKISALSCHETQKGRFYLERDYQTNKSLFYASSVGYQEGRNQKRYEAFNLIYCVEK